MGASAAGRAFNAAMTTAGQIMKTFDPHCKTESGTRLHISFDYMCCYTDEEMKIIKHVWSSTTWPAFNVTFGKPAWRIDGDGPDHFSIIVLLDEESNARMVEWADEVEAAIEAAGVKVHIPRSKQEPFHSTLGVVNGSTFPMEQALASINQIVPEGTWTGTVPLELTTSE